VGGLLGGSFEPRLLPVSQTTHSHSRVLTRECCGVALGGMLEEWSKTSQGDDGWTEKETMSTTRSYDEIIDFIAAGTTPEAVVAFRPSDAVQQRVAELVERSKDGSISPEDQSELEDYLQLEHIMIMAKARARQHTHLGQ
jgi:hypothetical protein